MERERKPDPKEITGKEVAEWFRKFQEKLAEEKKKKKT